MDTFGAFLLALAAFIGTVMIFIDPSQKLMKWARGKSKDEIKAAADMWIKEHESSEIVWKGCGFVFFLLLALLYTFVIEPLAVLSALLNNLGYQPLAFAMLMIVSLAWAQYAIHFARRKEIQAEEKIRLPSPAVLFLRRLFFSLPTFYLWYLFLVVLHIL